MTNALWVTYLLLAVTLVNGQAVSQSRVQVKRDLLLEMFQNQNSVASSDLFNRNKVVHKEIVEEIIEEELNNNSSTMVINFVANQRDEFLNFAYMKIYQTIKKKNLNDYVLFNLAFQINKDQCRGNVISLLNLFPPSLRVLLAPNQICIKNRENSEYLYAGADDLRYDAIRRNLFTLRPRKETYGPCDWRFEHVEGNKFQIFNSVYNEYLYAESDSCSGYDNDRRRIFTRQQLDLVLTGTWAVEMDGNDVFLRNALYDEYIYTLRKTRGDQERTRISSWIPGNRAKCEGDTLQCRWILLICQD